MKQLFIIRHAKSDQNFLGNDFERPLNERGTADAPVMAKKLLDKSPGIAALISSPATRAKNTATIFAETLHIPTDDVILVSALYHAPSNVFYEVLTALPDSLQSVAIFSHNPGITHFINSLNSGAQIDNMPTCGIFAVASPVSNWAGFAKAKKEFLFFDYPKKPDNLTVKKL